MNLSPNTDGSARVTATLSQEGSSRKVTVDSDVPFTHLQQFFMASEKLALLGKASNTDAVAVFDLKSGNELDWFYCYAPQRVWENCIAFVEWYPNHTPELTTDVVLIYDLGISPYANRIDNSAAKVLPPIKKTGRQTRVGVPIFPESNVTHGTCTNVVEDQKQVHLISGGTGFCDDARQEACICCVRGAP